jgi:hypothetical protein
VSFKNVDIESAMRRLADRRIEEAMREGKFDNLPGAGKPLELEPIPANEDARLVWWALRILRQNDFTPEEVRWRKRLDGFREELAAATTERRVKALVLAHNQLVHELNTLGTNALKSPVVAVSLETELGKLRERLQEGPVQSGPARVLQQPCGNDVCRCANPQGARFCRRCGQELAA